MKQGPNQKRHRGRSNGRRHQHGLSSNYESNGPEVKIKGSASQVQDRYQALARDAIASGDRVAAENYYQHAEHYLRIINAHLATTAANAANAVDGNGAARVNGGREQPEARQRSDDGRQRADDGRSRGEDQRPSGRGRGRGRGRAPAAVEAAEPDVPQPEVSAASEQPTAPDVAKSADSAGDAAAETDPKTGDNATA